MTNQMKTTAVMVLPTADEPALFVSHLSNGILDLVLGVRLVTLNYYIFSPSDLICLAAEFRCKNRRECVQSR